MGLNDIIYLIPEFSPGQYSRHYPDQKASIKDPNFKEFFHRYANYEYESGGKNVPSHLSDLDQNLCSAIERESNNSDLRGKSFINLLYIPNGLYTILYIRVG